MSGNVDGFENHDVSLLSKSQTLVVVDVVGVHEGGGKR